MCSIKGCIKVEIIKQCDSVTFFLLIPPSLSKTETNNTACIILNNRF